MKKYDIGLIGLAVMGQNLVLNMANHGFSVAAYVGRPELPNLLVDPFFAAALSESQSAWREVVSESFRLELSIPAFSSSLAYYDGYRSGRISANLLQAQRDYFGAHTYERVDRPRGEFFHTEWAVGSGQ